MALVHDDFVQETSTTTGTGTYTLAGATAGHQAFSAIGNSNTCFYSATDGTDWETGIGTYTSAGTTLARTTVLTSSNGDAAVNWGAGTRKISCVLPSAKRSIPSANDSEVLGSATVSWGDLFLAEGGVINWDNGDVTLTQSGDTLTVAGGVLISTTTASAIETFEAVSTDAGAVSGPYLSLFRDSSSPAAADDIGGIIFNGRDSAANKQLYSAIVAGIVDATSGSEDSKLNLYNSIAGTSTLTVLIGAGVYTAGATGGDKGIDTVNAKTYYIDGTTIIATQAQQEAGTATASFAAPATQQFHPSACKCFGMTTGGGTPVLHANSYNMTSITDTATGRLTVTIATDFSSANWIGTLGSTCATNANRMVTNVTKAAGSVILETSSATTTLADPGTGWDWSFFGDQ